LSDCLADLPAGSSAAVAAAVVAVVVVVVVAAACEFDGCDNLDSMTASAALVDFEETDYADDVAAVENCEKQNCLIVEESCLLRHY
jgi:hypothetical protein